MKTEKKAQIAAEKWKNAIHGTRYVQFSHREIKEAYIAGYMAEEEITPGPWKDNPGYQPEESLGKRVDIISRDKGEIDDVDADYQEWYEDYIDTIVEWRLHDEG